MSSYLIYTLYTLTNHNLSRTKRPPSSLSSSSSSRKKIMIGSRKSKLAMVQTNIVKKLLESRFPEIEFEILAITTTGDNNQTTALHEFGAKALWTRELEELMVGGVVDMIVHSLKDMPTELPAGCRIGAILEREDPRDALVMKSGSPHKTISDLPAGSVVGTSSVRRSAQLAKSYPHLKFADVRGNIGTRLSKLDDPSLPYDCLVLAAAGLIRLDLGERISEFLSHPVLLHAVGQGALGVEIPEGNEMVVELVEGLIHLPTMLACTAERSLMRALEGGCSVPIGVETEWVGSGGVLKMKAIVSSVDGTRSVEVEEEMEVGESLEKADTFGKAVAGKLVEGGAGEILKEIQSNRSPVVDV